MDVMGKRCELMTETTLAQTRTLWWRWRKRVLIGWSIKY